MLLFLLLIFILHLVHTTQLQVVGNLAVVAKHDTHVAYENKELKVHVGKLWCGVQNLGEDVTVAYGHFIRTRDGKQFEGEIVGKHVVLDVGKAPSTVAGKYKCEVRTDDDDLLNGYLFIYMAPVLHIPAGAVTELPQSRPPKVLGSKIRASEGDLLTLKCPVFGYPEPFVHWEKFGQAVASDRAEYRDNDLILSSVRTSDSGVYRCTADNSFPIFVGGPSIAHQLIYDQTVHIA